MLTNALPPQSVALSANRQMLVGNTVYGNEWPDTKEGLDWREFIASWSSSSTHVSGSAEAALINVGKESGLPISAKAQAAWDRTSGSACFSDLSNSSQADKS